MPSTTTTSRHLCPSQRTIWGWKDVGYAGSSFYRTPNIDRLARDGVQFSQAYSAACVCSPSRGVIYSGKEFIRLYNYSAGRFLLYDLAADPHELKDLAV